MDHRHRRLTATSLGIGARWAAGLLRQGCSKAAFYLWRAVGSRWKKRALGLWISGRLDVKKQAHRCGVRGLGEELELVGGDGSLLRGYSIRQA